MTTMTDEKLIEESYALALCKSKCYETLRKRRYRGLTKSRYQGFAFLVGAYDVEKYMWNRGFAMTIENVERLEQAYLWGVAIFEPLGRPTTLTYLDGVRAALDMQEWENAEDIELC